MSSEALVWLLAAFLLSSFAADGMIRAAKRLGIVDKPGGRKIHAQPMPLLGGVGIYLALAACVGIALFVSPTLTSGLVTPALYAGFLVGGLVLVVGGALDDKFTLPPWLSILPPLLAALVAVAAGINVSKLTNPFGGIYLVPHWLSDLIVFAWLLIVMYTTKLLDGLDGLSTGIAAIGTTMILLLSLTVAYFQPDVALLSSIVLGALLGFLVWNFHPAKIFLGEGGSTLVGYALGILAVISGGKLATALLAVGIPLLDLAWTVLRRVSAGGWKNAFRGDRRHLHHRLFDLGWGQRRIVLSYYAVAAVFGLAALFLQSRAKLFALGLLAVAMLSLILWIVRYERSRAPVA